MPNKTTMISSTNPAPASDLDIAQQEVSKFTYEISRATCALRSLGEVMSDPDHPIDPGNIGGLCLAVTMVGDYLELFADDRQYLLDHIEQERLAGGR
ncbi:hypothetical protein [Franzmannia qiaohouensis]|uniref:Uncharacterized protein n=1 Tax=Franzmannia qiaohouensis TaxID=1329370 RepID=A0ABU1H983_9GAMM|nr:hypothetical protein [Halomonas qiaohouensis]MDR5904011.1 hypothetical protein [Halomonas qiaohouensis]